MTTTRIRLFALALLMVMLVAGCSRSEEKRQQAGKNAAKTTVPAMAPGPVLLSGAGATFPAPLYQQWFSLYMKSHPGVVVKYEAVGSGAGIERFMAKGVPDNKRVDFGASDAAMTDDEISGMESGVTMMPLTAGGVVLAYNIPGLQGRLRLSRKAYASIFLGKIQSWNDPVIKECNPGLNLPKLTIATVVRSDASGTTFAFTKHLAAISRQWRESYGAAKLIDWPGRAMRARGNEGGAGLVDQSAGAIGYMELGFAQRLGLDTAVLENKAGNYITPSPRSAKASMASAVLPQNLRLFIPDPDGPDSYPIVTLTWVLLYDRYNDPQKVQTLKDLFSWCLHTGQTYSQPLGYLPLPDNIVRSAVAALSRITP
ncbi:MAG: phosphate ABC transporter substrate-binding protein PstS [Syntrophobacteraceae bacterium]|nr:phosphate ABC transporter substrate-binding protein PstS [Syntrophobacteraceae bacterium]